MLFYVIPKMAKYKGHEEDCAIAISYVPNDEEKHLSDFELTKLKADWVAKQLFLPRLFVIPVTYEEYMSFNENK